MDYFFMPLEISNFIDMIKDAHVRDKTKETFLECPRYFWNINASTSGKHHGGETLLEHVLIASSMMTKNVWRQLGDKWTDNDRDVSLSAILLHDCWKCGIEGEHFPIGEVPHTVPQHPQIAADKVISIFGDSDIARRIAHAVRFHMGPWGEDPGWIHRVSFSSPSLQVHLVDAYSTWVTAALRPSTQV